MEVWGFIYHWVNKLAERGCRAGVDALVVLMRWWEACVWAEKVSGWLTMRGEQWASATSTAGQGPTGELGKTEETKGKQLASQPEPRPRASVLSFPSVFSIVFSSPAVFFCPSPSSEWAACSHEPKLMRLNCCWSMKTLITGLSVLWFSVSHCCCTHSFDIYPPSSVCLRVSGL